MMYGYLPHLFGEAGTDLGDNYRGCRIVMGIWHHALQMYKRRSHAHCSLSLLSHLKICFSLWKRQPLANKNTAAQAQKRLKKLQNRAARIATDSPYDAHLEPLIKEPGWLTTKQPIDTETEKIVYKALCNKASKYLKDLFHRLIYKIRSYVTQKQIFIFPC